MRITVWGMLLCETLVYLSMRSSSAAIVITVVCRAILPKKQHNTRVQSMDVVVTLLEDLSV